MATNPKPIRRHYKEALRTYKRYTGIRPKPLKDSAAYKRFNQRLFKNVYVRYYVLIGRNPVAVSFHHWGVWFEYSKNRIIKQITLPDGVRVSTVFLGLDHSFMPDGPPVLYETMIFGGAHNGYQDRYTTYEAALAGHLSAIAKTFEV